MNTPSVDRFIVDGLRLLGEHEPPLVLVLDLVGHAPANTPAPFLWHSSDGDRWLVVRQRLVLERNPPTSGSDAAALDDRSSGNGPDVSHVATCVATPAS